MESGFIYSTYVTGKNFVGRKSEAAALGNLLRQGENVAIYAPPRSGKRSLIHQACFNLRIEGEQFNIAELSFLNSRSISDILIRLASSLIKMTGSSQEDYAEAVSRYLYNTHFTFDEQIYEAKGMAVSVSRDVDENDIKSVFTLPYRIAEERGIKTIVILEEFQNIMMTECGEKACNILEDIFRSLTPEGRKKACYVLCGSQVNAMKEIFEHKKLFWRLVEHLELIPVSNKDIVDHAIKCFLTTGKVIDKDLMTGVSILFKGNLWYINHFCAICDSLSKGYIMEPVLNSALEQIIAIHEPAFSATMNDLTTFQICFLRAILDGHTKFCSTEVIERYSLSSSANVKRLRDALCKKEIITFDENDQPVILDPLFEYWVGKYFFEIK
ncbi:MAG: hypothetical protein MJY53_00045 [Bacteroidales bacterium]|nr:hypothetical protein [Bacteroidales bacterium]